MYVLSQNNNNIPPTILSSCVDLTIPRNDPSETVKRHIRLLHEYNEIKDIAQGLMGLIAEARGVRHVDVQQEYGVEEQD